ncbi:MAG: RNA pseudouridine synthase [Myxococcaceae bacterium]|jgi:RluA family pseudouridine synthase|nr:RNA pseudouridine synthase [Myxococcaceae bacterium]MCA3016234.1 RNA pseudouridine synthase [Myxococcaceae bacterium]
MTSLPLLTPAGPKGLFAVDKPAGMLVIPGRAGEAKEGPCVRDLVSRQLGRPVWVVHRIDRDTSGVLLLALDADAHRAASLAFERHEVKKTYLALVQGVVREPLDIGLPLVEARKRKMKVAPPGLAGKPSRTVVRPVETFARATLVACEPLTGRQHQIRVHLMAKGHPLLVDHQYGRREPLRERDVGGASDEVVLSRTPLHAAKLELPSLGFVAESPLPADLRAVVERLAGGATPRGHY